MILLYTILMEEGKSVKDSFVRLLRLTPPFIPSASSVRARWSIQSIFGERDIAWRHVDHEDTIAFQVAKNGLHFGPALLKLLLLFGPPIRHDFFREVRRLIEIHAGKIEDEGPAHHCH